MVKDQKTEVTNIIDTVEQLTEKYPDLTKKLIDSVTIKPITTIEQLAAAYPELVKKIKDSAIIDSSIQLASLQKSDGFLLGIKDPYAEGALRLYKQITGNNLLDLPCVVPFKDKSAVRVINNYLLRAKGGCDKKREEIAAAALKKCK